MLWNLGCATVPILFGPPAGTTIYICCVSRLGGHRASLAAAVCSLHPAAWDQGERSRNTAAIIT